MDKKIDQLTKPSPRRINSKLIKFAGIAAGLSLFAGPSEPVIPDSLKAPIVSETKNPEVKSYLKSPERKQTLTEKVDALVARAKSACGEGGIKCSLQTDFTELRKHGTPIPSDAANLDIDTGDYAIWIWGTNDHKGSVTKVKNIDIEFKGDAASLPEGAPLKAHIAVGSYTGASFAYKYSREHISGVQVGAYSFPGYLSEGIQPEETVRLTTIGVKDDRWDPVALLHDPVWEEERVPDTLEATQNVDRTALQTFESLLDQAKI